METDLQIIHMAYIVVNECHTKVTKYIIDNSGSIKNT